MKIINYHSTLSITNSSSFLGKLSVSKREYIRLPAALRTASLERWSKDWVLARTALMALKR